MSAAPEGTASAVRERLEVDVVVVGGGLDGLAAALHCAHVGLKVAVLEEAESLGGPAALPLGDGADAFPLGLRDRPVNAERGLAEWLSQLQEGPVFETSPERLALARAGGRFTPVPRDAILGIPGAPLDAPARALLGARAATRAFLERWIPVLTIGRASRLESMVDRMGPGVLRSVVEPLLRDRYGVGAAEADPAMVAPGLGTSLTNLGNLAGAVLAQLPAYERDEALHRPEGGIAALASALVRELQRFDALLLAGSTVDGIAVGGRESVIVATSDPDGAQRSIRARGAALAVPLPRLAELAGLGLEGATVRALEPDAVERVVPLGIVASLRGPQWSAHSVAQRARRGTEAGRPVERAVLDAIVVPEALTGDVGGRWRVELVPGAEGVALRARGRETSPAGPLPDALPEAVLAVADRLGQRVAPPGGSGAFASPWWREPASPAQREARDEAVRVVEERLAAFAAGSASLVALGPWRSSSEPGALMAGSIAAVSPLRSRLIGTR